MKTSLYRHFDKTGRLLYVGVSLSAMRRLSEHSGNSAWAASIARVTIEHFQTREQALDAERLAVRAERPLYNIRLRDLPPKSDPVKARKNFCSETTRKAVAELERFAEFQCLKPETVCSVFGLNKAELSALVKTGAMPAPFMLGKASPRWMVSSLLDWLQPSRPPNPWRNISSIGRRINPLP
jgi:predicted DNA-binding transcriptional regulator AlpA